MGKYRFEIDIELAETLRTAGEIQKLALAVADTVGQHFDHIIETHGVEVTPRGVVAMDFKVVE